MAMFGHLRFEEFIANGFDENDVVMFLERLYVRGDCVVAALGLKGEVVDLVVKVGGKDLNHAFKVVG